MDFDSFVLAASTANLAEEPDAREHADAVEFRMDLADDPLAALADYEGELPLIVTNRADWEGGEAADGPERLEALQEAAEHAKVETVDIELTALEEDPLAEETAAHAREHGADVIASAHDFETTPEREELYRLLSRATSAGDVGKIAVTAAAPDDVLTLLAVTRSLTTEGETVATMAMGEAGQHSRAVAPLYGSRIGYAPVDPEAATAPGQYDLATLDHLVGALGGRV